jgi:uncharacterized repeat protein (TIGR01451 family)
MRLIAFVVAFLAGCGVASAQLVTLALQTSDANPVAGGADFTYTITVNNTQVLFATLNLTVTLPLGSGIVAKGVSVSGASFSCTAPPIAGNGTVECRSPRLPALTSATITVTAAVAAPTAAGVRTTTARLQSGLGQLTAQVQQNLQVNAPLTLSLLAPARAVAGDTLVYQMNVSNGGASTALAGTSTLTLPTGTRFLGLYASGGLAGRCSANGGGTQVTCGPRELASGVHSLTVVAQTFPGVTPVGSIGATATLSGGTGTVSGSPANASTQLFATRPPTTTGLVPSSNAIPEGGNVTLTATVSGTAPTGHLAFRLVNTTLPGCGAVPLVGGGDVRFAACVTPLLADGAYTFAATYSGDAFNASSVGTAAITVTPVAGAACAGFTDVDSADPFCPSVDWLRNRAVTTGCGGSLYCPLLAVSRLGMAAFMNRLGTALTEQPVVVEATGGALDPDAGTVVCATGPIASSGFARRVVLDGVFRAQAGVGTDVTLAVGVVVSPDGVSWTPVAGGEPATVTPLWRNLRAQGVYDAVVNEPMRFGLRVTRGGGVGGTLDATSCILRALSGSRDSTYSPFDAGPQ